MAKAWQKVRQSVLITLGTVYAASALAGTAEAHDAVIGGEPANGSVVAEFPDVLTLEFSGQPQDGFNTFALSRIADNEILFTGEPTLDGRFVSLELPEAVRSAANDAPGEYRIGFQIVSSDGHATKGMTTFSFTPDGGEIATDGDPHSAAESQENGSSFTSVTWVGVGVCVLLAGAVLAVFLLRRGKSERQ
ncbi:hypothetical protein BJP07_04065 [Corynebacterium sp. NML130628]|nr:hypothetical protein BJP07_04065 [Corynebacterium sp. NML130628]